MSSDFIVSVCVAASRDNEPSVQYHARSKLRPRYSLWTSMALHEVMLHIMTKFGRQQPVQPIRKILHFIVQELLGANSVETVFPLLQLEYWRLNLFLPFFGARCSSVVKAFAYGAMGRGIDPSWWTHSSISRSSQCSTTGVTKGAVCAILSMGWCI